MHVNIYLFIFAFLPDEILINQIILSDRFISIAIVIGEKAIDYFEE